MQPRFSVLLQRAFLAHSVKPSALATDQMRLKSAVVVDIALKLLDMTTTHPFEALPTFPADSAFGRLQHDALAASRASVRRFQVEQRGMNRPCIRIEVNSGRDQASDWHEDVATDTVDIDVTARADGGRGASR